MGDSSWNTEQRVAANVKASFASRACEDPMTLDVRRGNDAGGARKFFGMITKHLDRAFDGSLLASDHARIPYCAFLCCLAENGV